MVPKPVLALAVGLLLAASVLAQSVVPIADQFQVNSHTAGDQRLPDAAVDGGGAFVVVWESLDSPGTDTSGEAIVARRFDSGGLPLGEDFQVNTHVNGAQIAPRIAMRPGGEFMVVWGSESAASGDPFYSVQGQLFDAQGVPQGGELLVNQYTTNVQEAPDVAVSAEGQYLVVWQSSGSFGPDGSGRSIQGRFYAPDGSPVGSQFQVNTYAAGDQAGPAVAARPAPDGGFLVVWFNVSGNGAGDTSGRSVQGQLLGNDGSLVGGELQVNTYTDGDQTEPVVAVDGGGSSLVAWVSAGSFGTDDDVCVLGQRLDVDGLPVGGEVQVNAFTEGVQASADVACGEGGGCVVVWGSGNQASAGPDGDNAGVAMQAYSTDGTPDGPEAVANTYTTGAQTEPSIAAGPDRTYLVVWQSEGSPGDDPDRSIQARLFAGWGLFADGFEAGDTERWSETAE